MMALLAIEIPFLNRPFWGATTGDYLWFTVIVCLTMLLKKPISRFFGLITSGIAVRFSKGKYRKLFRSLIRKPVEWLFASIAFFYAFSLISVPLSKVILLRFHRKNGLFVLNAADIIEHVFFFFAILFTAQMLSRIVDFIYRTQMEDAHHSAQKERTQVLPLLKEIVKGLVWTMAFFWMLGVVFSVNIPALITGLGIGGVALALAAKESIENLFASLTILTDKPFQVGDTVKVGGLEGKVERIGFRSARLRGSDGSLYIIPNKKLVDENLENLTQRDTRGVKVTLNIKYGMPEATLQQMIDELKTMVQKTLHVIEPVRISLEHFNEKVFQVVISYHLPEPLINSNEADIKQVINMKTYEIVTKYSKVTDVKTETEEEA